MRGWVATSPVSRPTILFDGICNLCNSSVRFAIANDPTGRFAFASLQSDVARDLLARFGRMPETTNSIVLVDTDGLHDRSDAALRIALGLRAPFPLLFGAILIPKKIRDAVYTFIANNRYRWFGTSAACPLPTPGSESRFL